MRPGERELVLNDGPPSAASDRTSRTIEVEIAPDDIDGDFVPRARHDVAWVQVDKEIVLGRVAAGTQYVQTCALNESGSIVWQCFDGSGTIAAIAADIAEVFGADRAAVSADVLALARDLGSIGFLVGVHEKVLDIGDEPTGIAIGVPFPDFDATDEDGTRCSGEQLRGRRALLVSWSSTCSFCELITDNLAELAPSLARVGVDIVLLATGGARANRASLDRSEAPLACRLWLHDDDTAAGFDGMGTPVAYLIDEEGAVAEPVALGSTEVVQLARRIIGLPDLGL